MRSKEIDTIAAALFGRTNAILLEYRSQGKGIESFSDNQAA